MRASSEDRIIVDSSAVLAIFFCEPEESLFVEIIFSASERWISSITLLEAGSVALSRHGPGSRSILNSLFQWLRLEVIPFTADHLQWAYYARERFGKGRHSACLNLCDCCSYGLAKWAEAPLLFKGNDFTQTDLELIRYWDDPRITR